ncbi:hypothetical protein FQR65_LT18788 [Abscondita terminalis]|nr:hypothetical protein FQR65_LT18788 [Abscondita terminalis]
MDLEQYQQSIAQMNSSLHDIQADIQRLASQQNQIQVQQQSLVHHPVHQPYQQQIPHYPNQHYNAQPYSPQGAIYNPLQSYSSAPHIPQAVYNQQIPPSPPMHQEQHFYLHSQPQQPVPTTSSPPVATQRRTWAQQVNDSYQTPEIRTWSKPQQQQQPTPGFVLHNNSDRYDDSRYTTSPRYNENSRYQNGDEYPLNRSSSHPGFTLSQQHIQQQLFSGSQTTPSTSPQHRNSNDHQLNEGISRLNITSGRLTYRIPSPTRPLIARNSFQPLPVEPEPSVAPEEDTINEKGFYISFDNDQPKRPKPPLRTKKGSPKKEISFGDTSEKK